MVAALSAPEIIGIVVVGTALVLLALALLVRVLSGFAHTQIAPDIKEAEVVAAEVRTALVGSNPAEAGSQAAPIDKWVTHRFETPLQRLIRQARTDTVGHRATNLVIIGGGFGTSGLAVAAGDDPSKAVQWTVFGIGLLVALAGGVAQTFRLGPRAGGRQALAAELRGEGWALVNRHGTYTPTAIEAAGQRFEQFDARVSDIHRRAREIATPEGPAAEQSPSTPDGTGQAGQAGGQQS